MKDLLKRELAVGDQVAVAGRGINKGLHYGEIIKVSPKMVRVKLPFVVRWDDKPEEILSYPEDVVKLEPIDVTYFLMVKK